MKKAEYKVWYRFTDYGDRVEVMLFVEDTTNEMVLVAQNEGEYENMKAAEYYIQILQESGAEVELVEIGTYTG